MTGKEEELVLGPVKAEVGTTPLSCFDRRGRHRLTADEPVKLGGKERLILRGVINDTFETSIRWERFEQFHDVIKAAIGNAIFEMTESRRSH